MIELTNFTKFSVDKKFFLRVAKRVLKGENKELENLSVAFVALAEIKKINKKYRGKNKVTDVLSLEKSPNFKADFLQVIICPAVVRENAKKFKTTFKKEMASTLIHGILHCLGYDHERSRKEAEIMFGKQESYITRIFTN